MSFPFTIVETLLEQITELRTASPNLDASALILRLKKSNPTIDPQLISIACETSVARQTAGAKLGPWGTQGFFPLALLEQASRAAIAVHRASYFSGLRHVLEIGTGTGSDTAALARMAKEVTTLEIDPVRAELAKRNLSLQGINNVNFLIGGMETLAQTKDISSFDGFFADPARRTTSGQRVKESADYSPPLSDLLQLTRAKVSAIKVSPGLFFDAPAHGWSRQFVGFGDECLEQTLWRGAPVVDSSVYVADCQSGWSPPSKDVDVPAEPDSIEGFLCEAHSCINRSQHLAQFFAERGISQIAPEVAYGISINEPPPSPLLSAFAILDAFPFTMRKLSDTVRTLGWTNRTEIKKRNIADDPDVVRRALALPTHHHNAPYGVIILLTWHRKPWAILARRVHE